MAPLTEVRWGIIGVGDVCEVKAGPGFQKAGRSKLVAVMRRSGEKAADFARRHGVARWYDTVEGLLGDPEVDAVYVASPVGAHAEHALACCRAGKPTLLEKPMARCAEEARGVVQAFREAGVPLWIAYYRRAHPVWQRVKGILSDGRIGKVTGVRYELRWEQQQADTPGGAVPWRLQPEASGGGLILDVGSHAIDIIDFLLGPIQVRGAAAWNAAGGAAAQVEDRVEALIQCGDVAGSFSFDFAGPPGSGKRDLLSVSGTAGSVEACVTASNAATLRFWRDGQPHAEEFSDPPGAHMHQALIQTIVDELCGVAGAACPSPAESGMRASEVLDAALCDFYGGREDGFWAAARRVPPPLEQGGESSLAAAGSPPGGRSA
eukprot:TRINITY_DN40019_c0_g1_i1.p1 TRINITY_DN40019_c0_g1~~TRINITY_DN40019_c0_g1_i1.p1  ORF type:complete len:377 (+),score=90.63 TRINITY_DN40019_c0_g1_i1:80-1210(+)